MPGHPSHLADGKERASPDISGFAFSSPDISNGLAFSSSNGRNGHAENYSLSPIKYGY